MMTWRSLFRYSAKPANAFAKAERLGYDEALSWAQKNLAPDLQHTLHLMRANRDCADEAQWCEHLSAYLAHFGAAPVFLAKGSEPRIERLETARDPDIDGGPLVTVIMCAWNAEATIGMAAKSILNQSWRNLEIIIVDDASSDDTSRKIASIAASDKRVKVITNAANVGPYVSRNLALGMATGRLITCHDADDWAHPNRISSQYHFARAHGLAIALGSMLRVQADGKFTRFTRPSSTNPDGLLRQAFVSAFFDADFLRNRLGYWDSVRVSGDAEMIERAQKVQPNAVRTDNNLTMICLDREESLTNDPKTGLHQDGSLSASRRLYRKFYREWHAKGRLTMPFPHHDRVFPVPPEISVSADHVAYCLAVHP